jgi:uncharacterized protein (DUF1684 family)
VSKLGWGQITVFTLTFAVCAAFAADKLAGDYARKIEQFRAQREKDIAGKDGWITLAGLFWLKEGTNRVGADESFEVALPPSAPKRAGVIEMTSGVAKFVPASGVAAKTTIFKNNDDTSAVTLGGVKFFVIKRDGKLAVRVKDSESAARKQFTGLVWYPIDPSWRIAAKFTPWPTRHTIVFGTAAGTKEEMVSPGSVTFSKGGHEYHLDPVMEDGRLFFVMRDATSGKSTYGAARFVYADAPASGLSKPGTVWLDFNQAMNPPCMFTPYATCPLPPPQNRLTIEVTAGEKLYGKDHAAH